MSPFKSESQRRLFYAAAAGRATKGPSQAVAKKFIADSGHEGGKLPERLGELAKRRGSKQRTEEGY
jgi:hypothetical protein